ncbi:MAG: hypothetical protein ACLPP9_09470, partial [Smithella sp.]
LLGTNSQGVNGVNAYGVGGFNPGGINIGLKNMAIGVGGLQMIIKVGAYQALTDTATTMTMGTAFISNVNTTVNGNIIISTH